MNSMHPRLHLEVTLASGHNLECLVDGIQHTLEFGSLVQALPQGGGCLVTSPLIVGTVFLEDLVDHVLGTEAPGGFWSQEVG